MRKLASYFLMAALLLLNLYAAPIAAATENNPINVPLRIICESKGANISCSKDWITIKKGGVALTVNAKSNAAIINGKPAALDSRIQVVNNRLKVPLSLLNKAFGWKLAKEDAARIIAVQYFKMLQEGRINDCTMLYSSDLSQDATGEIVKRISAGLASYGDLKMGEASIDKNALHVNVAIGCNSILTGPFKYIIRFDTNLQIDDFMIEIVPSMPYIAPQYDHKLNYEEKEVVIGQGKWRLPGVLTVPKGDGPFPVAVLVHGSGPEDMDETIGPLKPFRDIAVGLASKGIAVLRYNKRSFEHNASFALEEKMTVREETVDDALTAVNYLKSIPEIDSSRIFVIGHSQGAMLVPMLLNQDKEGLIRGAVMMSGNSRPLQDVTIDQYQYFYKLGQMTKEQLNYYTTQYNMINDPNFTADHPPKDFALGNTYWWADLKSYNQIKAAKEIQKPLLILQGARDYQVLAEKDYQGWKDALSDKPNVSFKLYPKLNHMYTEGEGGMSTNAEYFNQANVPSYVIDDIGSWINSK